MHKPHPEAFSLAVICLCPRMHLYASVLQRHCDRAGIIA